MALFCGAALAALASIIATVKHHSGAVIALLSQFEGSTGQSASGHRKHRVYTRHVKPGFKPQCGLRAWSRARRAGRDLRSAGKLSAMQRGRARKTVHNRNYGFRLAQLSDRLAIE